MKVQIQLEESNTTFFKRIKSFSRKLNFGEGITTLEKKGEYAREYLLVNRTNWIYDIWIM